MYKGKQVKGSRGIASPYEQGEERMKGIMALANAVIIQALKEDDLNFFETEQGKLYCASIGMKAAHILYGLKTIKRGVK